MALIIIIAFFSLSFASTASDTIIDSGLCGDDLMWELTGDSNNMTLTISGNGSMNNYDYDSYAPWRSYRKKINTVILPKTLTSIGRYAFSNCNRIKEVVIPDGVKIIDNHAFGGCSNLTSVVIPNTVTTIGDGAFLSCGFTFIKIPDSVATIGDGAFWLCTDLQSITLPPKIEAINNRTFYKCENLKKVYITNSVKKIHSHAFVESEVKQLYYNGTKAQWDTLDDSFLDISPMDIHCNDFVYHSYLLSSLQGASCGVEGKKVMTCAGCGDTYEETIPITNPHTYNEIIITKATCKKSGKILFDCQVCHYSYEETIKKTAHNYKEEIVKKPTCGESGIKKYTCSICGDYYNTRIPKTSTHNYKERIVVKPTCIEGLKEYTCTDCGKTYKEKLPVKQEHKYDNGVITKQARDGKTGIKTYTCTLCRNKSNEIIYPCDTCDGKGKIGAIVTKTKNNYVTCSACKGVGKRDEISYNRKPCTSCIKDANGNPTGKELYKPNCYECGGLGMKNYRDGKGLVTCRKCYGRKYVSGTEYYITCKKCNGTKNVIHEERRYGTCTNCSGAGKTKERYDVFEYVVCPKCGGNDYYITYNANGGKGAPKKQTVHTLKPIVLSKAVPTMSNKTFMGWSTKKNGKVEYKSGAKIKDLSKDLTLFAVWKDKQSNTSNATNSPNSGTNSRDNNTNVNVSFVRVYDRTRYTTATKIADVIKKQNNGKHHSSIILATGTNYPDALGGAYIAKVKNAPIIITNPSEEANTINYIKKNLASGGTVYILGGTGAIPNSFVTKLKSANIKNKRLGGNTRYETNIKILKEAGSLGSELIVVTGKNFPDALSASAVGKPVLLVGESLTREQTQFVKNGKFTKITIIGGKGVVSEGIKTALSEYGKVSRVYGTNRYETSAKVAEKYFGRANNMVLAIGNNYPDALTGGPLGIKLKAPLILTSSNSKDYGYARSYRKSAGVKKGYILGGPTLIDNQAAINIMK